MSIELFDNMNRDDTGMPRSGETEFGYLNRSGRVEAQRVRELIQGFLDRYPQDRRGALASRLRSPIDRDHVSALFELVLHEFMLRAGHRVVAIEPKLDHTNRSPDFLIEPAGGGRFYLEAVLTTGQSREEAAASVRLETAIGAIDAVASAHYFLCLSIEGSPAAPVTLHSLRRQLTAWVRALEQSGITSCIPGEFEYAEHGVSFRIRAFPRGSSGSAGRTIGARVDGLKVAVPGEGIRERLKDKASRYGRLDAPYVVAVNSLDVTCGERDVIDALFGTPQYTFRLNADGSVEDERQTRASDGVWHSKRPQNTGLSAVLSFDRLHSWSIAQAAARLVRNPWAASPLPPTRLFVPELNLENDSLVTTPGSSLREAFDLPPEWPE